MLYYRNDNENLILDFNNLNKSEKFIPMIYDYNTEKNTFHGESISFFTKETKFVLKETIKDNTMYVSERFYKNDKITFVFEDPIIYKKDLMTKIRCVELPFFLHILFFTMNQSQLPFISFYKRYPFIHKIS